MRDDAVGSLVIAGIDQQVRGLKADDTDRFDLALAVAVLVVDVQFGHGKLQLAHALVVMDVVGRGLVIGGHRTEEAEQPDLAFRLVLGGIGRVRAPGLAGQRAASRSASRMKA